MVQGPKESRNQHFVPRFLLRPWIIEVAPGQRKLVGYYRDPRTKKIRQKIRGVSGFCTQLDLLTLSGHRLGRDAVERIFFGHIDTSGAGARDILVQDGVSELTVEQRRDFARLLLSLDMRRPVVVAKLRTEVRQHLASELDDDPEIRAALDSQGIEEAPSHYVESQLRWSLEDRALAIIQKLVDNPAVGGWLINAQWYVRALEARDANLILSDRPLIRILGIQHPNSTWVLPLSPRHAFIASNNAAIVHKLRDLPSRKFVRAVNTSGALQAERYVFSTTAPRESWRKFFRPLSGE